MARPTDEPRVDRGTNAFHEADEGWDDSKHVVYGKPPTDYGMARIAYWDSVPDRNAKRSKPVPFDTPTEMYTYQIAVESNPKMPDEGALAYAQRISEIVQKRFSGELVKQMPDAPVEKGRIE